MTNNIQYIKRKDIDHEKWNQCIEQAENGLIYGYSWYLDHLAENWDALVLNDYEVVMPLIWRKKYGIKYLYQPPFCQQSGLFGKTAIIQSQISNFLTIAQHTFRFIEICLNFNNPHEKTFRKNNFILPLQIPYEQIQTNFTTKLKYNLSRAQKENLHFRVLSNPHKVIDLYQKSYGSRFQHVSPADYSRFKKLCDFLSPEGSVITHETVLNDKPLALSLLLLAMNRLYLIISVTLPEGRLLRANHFHLNEVIKVFSNRELLLDFEGSDLPGVGHFYESYGSLNQPYYFYRHNQLPPPIRWLKR